MTFIYDTGGGPLHERNCVPRAIAIATGKGYAEVFGMVNLFQQAHMLSLRPGRKGRIGADNGVHTCSVWWPQLAAHFGLKRADLPVGWYRTETLLLPAARAVIVIGNRHATSVLADGVHDTHDPQRCGKLPMERLYYTS